MRVMAPRDGEELRPVIRAAGEYVRPLSSVAEDLVELCPVPASALRINLWR